MKKKFNQILFSFYGFTSLYPQDKCLQFINLLRQHNIQPLKFGDSEHCKYKYSEKDLICFWKESNTRESGFVFVKGDGFHIMVGWGGALPYSFGGRISTTVLSESSKIISFTKDLYLWYESFYGCVQQVEGADLYTPGLSRLHCLGGIAWANFFGKPYVDLWGEEKVLNAPVWKLESLADGGFLMITTDSPFTERDLASRAETALLEYIGKEHFYQRLDGEQANDNLFNPKDFKYCVPDFTKYKNDKLR